mmetsp:Transcript_25485/g.63667  ORF Transcript_25485/g.63667 Transcript_25485/m.63667 type:complete len:80 (+) Transcript_25485:325-564(+)
MSARERAGGHEQTRLSFGSAGVLANLPLSMPPLHVPAAKSPFEVLKHWVMPAPALGLGKALMDLPPRIGRSLRQQAAFL